LAGLRGMLPATCLSTLHIDGAANTQDLVLIRPLLDTPRAEIERYCRRHNLSPRFDRSNLDTTFFRNKLRHELLPLLEREYKPGLAHILRKSARVIRDDHDLLCTIRDRAWSEVVLHESDDVIIVDRAAWRALHPALQRTILRRATYALRRSLRDVNYVHIQSALEIAQQGHTGDRATLPGGLQLVIGYDRLTLADRAYTPVPTFPALPAPTGDAPERYSLDVPGATRLPTCQACVEIVPRTALPTDDWEQNDDPWRAFLDADALGPEPYLRRRRAGDRFQPLGMDGQSKLVSDLLVNYKVPAEWRDRVPLLVGTDGSIVWVCGQRIDERARICDTTSQVAIVHLTVKE
jgi:tRNA(Ile)-lysidine synthase